MPLLGKSDIDGHKMITSAKEYPVMEKISKRFMLKNISQKRQGF